jgi:hypothetical protein
MTGYAFHLRFLIVREYLIVYAPGRKAAVGDCGVSRASQSACDGCHSQKQRVSAALVSVLCADPK